MKRIYTIETWAVGNPRDVARWGVDLGPAELFRTTDMWNKRYAFALTRRGAKRKGRRIIRKNERQLKRQAIEHEIEEVIVSD